MTTPDLTPEAWDRAAIAVTGKPIDWDARVPWDGGFEADVPDWSDPFNEGADVTEARETAAREWQA